MTFSAGKFFLVILVLATGLMSQESDTLDTVVQEVSQADTSDTVIPEVSQGDTLDTVVPEVLQPDTLVPSAPVVQNVTSLVVTFTPAHGATDVPIKSNLTITFSEPVRNLDDSVLGNKNVATLITLKKGDRDGEDIPFTAKINKTKDVITVNPKPSFGSGKNIYMSIGATFEDPFGNVSAPSFAIFSAVDVVPPALTFNPDNNELGVALDSVLTISFNEPVRNLDGSPITDSDLANFINLRVSNRRGKAIPFKGVINAEKTAVIIDPVSDFEDDQKISLSLSAGIEDKYNNAVRASSITFSTVIKVAVIDIELQGLTTIENIMLSDYVRTELNDTRVAISMDRAEMLDILRNNAIDPSGCEADDCAAEIGTVLDVSYMVLTRFAKLQKSEDFVTSRTVVSGDVVMRLVDVKKQKAKNMVKKEFSGGVNRLGRIMRRMTWDLLAITPTEGRFALDVNKLSFLERIKIELSEFMVSPREWVSDHPGLAMGIGGFVLLSSGIAISIASQGPPIIGGPPEFPEVP